MAVRIIKSVDDFKKAYNDHVDELRKDGVLDGCSIGAFVDVIMTMTDDYEVDVHYLLTQLLEDV